MIEFNCSQCGHPIRVPESASGKRGNCKECGTLLRIPEAPDKALSDTNNATESAIEKSDRTQNQVVNLLKEPQIIFFSCVIVGIVLLAIIMAVTRETPEEAGRRTLEELRKLDEPYLRRIQQEKEEDLEKIEKHSKEMKRLANKLLESKRKMIEEQYRKEMQELERKAKLENERFIRDLQNDFRQQNQ